LDVVQEELSRLENAVRHLRRSNAEMKEELTSNGPDRELKEAIEVVLPAHRTPDIHIHVNPPSFHLTSRC